MWGVHNSCQVGIVCGVHTTLVRWVKCVGCTQLLSGGYSMWGVHNTCGYNVWGVHNSWWVGIVCGVYTHLWV